MNIENRISSLESRMSLLEKLAKEHFAEGSDGVTVSRKPKFKESKPLSIREFLLSKKAQSATKKTLAICFFLERYDLLSEFNVADIEAGFRAAREQVPKNINDLVNKNVVQGFVMEAKHKRDGKKCWSLTNSGEIFVETGLK